jgi:hypothetical protein
VLASAVRDYKNTLNTLAAIDSVALSADVIESFTNRGWAAAALMAIYNILYAFISVWLFFGYCT